MRDLITDANFPRTVDLRTYHLGLRPGEVANRIVTVGSPTRARLVASNLDDTPNPFTLSSERDFHTITGRYKGTPVSVVSIGMGHPNMDFFVREVRECVSGDMVVVRLGSCGALVDDVPVGSVVVPQASVAVTRNVDYDFVNGSVEEEPYRISKKVYADTNLHLQVCKSLEAACPTGRQTRILTGTVNASADSFYSSQGRQTSFPDHNGHLIEHLISSTKDLATSEMETFHLLHLASCWRSQPIPSNPRLTVPVQTDDEPQPAIRAAAAQLVFASRTSQAFITPEHVEELEAWTGRAVLDALCAFEIKSTLLHPDVDSVWERG